MINALRQSEVKHFLSKDGLVLPVMCDQRLTAIRGKTQQILVFQRLWNQVINALRQSEVEHFLAILRFLFVEIVINALRQSEVEHSSTSLTRLQRGLSDQRLTAIRGRTLVYDRIEGLRSIVINALRQSEVEHSRGQYHYSFANEVINALRQSEVEHAG